ncbi:hypothetical protein PG988_003252 [Apiospora saccharicola]
MQQLLKEDDDASFAMAYSSAPLDNAYSNTPPLPTANPALAPHSLPSPHAPSTKDKDQAAVRAAFQGSEVGRFVLAACPGIADEGVDMATVKRHLEEMLGLEPKNGLGRNQCVRSEVPRPLKCVTASRSLRRDPLNGACANCFFRKQGAKCSLRDPPPLRRPTAAAAREDNEEEEEEEEEENSEDNDDSGLRMFEASVKLLSSVAAVQAQAVPHRMLVPCSRIVHRTGTGTGTAKKQPCCPGCASRMERTKADAQSLQRDLEGLTRKLQEVCDLAHQFSTELAKTLPSARQSGSVDGAG